MLGVSRQFAVTLSGTCTEIILCMIDGWVCWRLVVIYFCNVLAASDLFGMWVWSKHIVLNSCTFCKVLFIFLNSDHIIYILGSKKAQNEQLLLNNDSYNQSSKFISRFRDVGRWGLICSICKRNTTHLRKHLKTTCMNGFSDKEVQMAVDASTIQMQRISRNFIVNMDDFRRMGGTKNLAKRLQERGFVFSLDSEIDTNVDELIIGTSNKVSTFQFDKRFMCDRNVLEKVLGGTSLSEKQTEICVPLSTRDSITFEETRYVGHSGEASHSIGMLKMIPAKQNLENVCKRDNIQARGENGDYCTSTENSPENDVIFPTMDSSDPDDVMLNQSIVTGENMKERNLGPLQKDILVDSKGIKSPQTLTTKFKYGPVKQEVERKKTSSVETNGIEKLKITSTPNYARQFKRSKTIIEGNITGEYKGLACLNDNVHLGEDEDEILKGNTQTDVKELVPIDKIATNDGDLFGTKPFLSRTRVSEYVVNAESKVHFGTRNTRSQIKNCMDDEKRQNEITQMPEPTNKNVSLPARTRDVIHCGSSRQGRKRKTSNSSAVRPVRIDICTDQSQEDDLVFFKMKDPVVVVEKLCDHVLFSDEVRCKWKRIKLDPMEVDDKIHLKRFQMDSIRFRRGLDKDTSYKKVGRRKNMPHEKRSDSRQVDHGGDGPKRMNNKPKLTRRTGDAKQFDLHQQANVSTSNVPCQNSEEEVVFLGMKLNDPFIVLGDIGKNTNYSQDHQYQKKKIKLESTIENTAREKSQFDPPSDKVEQFEISVTKNGKCNERTRQGEKQNHCQKAMITGMPGKRPVCMKKCEHPGEIIHGALIPNAAQGVEYKATSDVAQYVEYKATFSCLARKRMSQKGLYKLHNVDEGVLKDFYIYLFKERGNRTSHCAQITRTVGKILFYLNPKKLDLKALTKKTKLIQLYQELKEILKASSITIFLKSIYLFIEFMETWTNKTQTINLNSSKNTIRNLRHLNTRCVQKEIASRHYNATFNRTPTSNQLSQQLQFSLRIMTEEMEKAKHNKKFSICKLNIYFYMIFTFRHFQRKCVYENLTVEEWNKRMRHTTEMEETHIILAIKNHKTLSSQLAMIALSEEEEEQMKDYLTFARPKSLQKEFFLTSTGNKIRDASHLLTNYQKINRLRRITGTQARRILETSTWNMQDIERRSICDYLCHSTRVAEKYYRWKTPQSCVYARKVVQKLISAA